MLVERNIVLIKRKSVNPDSLTQSFYLWWYASHRKFVHQFPLQLFFLNNQAARNNLFDRNKYLWQAVPRGNVFPNCLFQLAILHPICQYLWDRKMESKLQLLLTDMGQVGYVSRMIAHKCCFRMKRNSRGVWGRTRSQKKKRLTDRTIWCKATITACPTNTLYDHWITAEKSLHWVLGSKSQQRYSF